MSRIDIGAVAEVFYNELLPKFSKFLQPQQPGMARGLYSGSPKLDHVEGQIKI